MLPYAYTNNDVAQLFSQYGKIARVTILRHKNTRDSRGAAFVQFSTVADCQKAIEQVHGMTLEGFTLSCSLSKDNGRSQEFMKKRKYTTKTKCFECGVEGHLSYQCPRNVLGERSKPRKRKRKKYNLPRQETKDEEAFYDLVTAEDADDAAILYSRPPTSTVKPRRRIQPSSYFSDEDA